MTAEVVPVTPWAALMRAIKDAGLELIEVDQRTSEVRRLGTIAAAQRVAEHMPDGWSITPQPVQLVMSL